MSENQDILQGSVMKLGDIFLLVDQNCSDTDTSDLTPMERIQLSQLNEKVKSYNGHFKRLCVDMPSRMKNNNFSFADMLPRFTTILRDCIYSHQWSEALKWVHALTKEVVYTDSTVWKAGLECLIQNGNQKLIGSYVRQLHALKSLTCVEVLFDYLLHLLTLGDLLEAKELTMELKKSDKFSQNVLSNERRKEAHLLFSAYQGLVLYLEWKTAISQKVKDEDSEDDMLVQDKLIYGRTSSKANVHSMADSAVEYFMNVRDYSGVWDIFLFKVVEIHEHYGKLDEAREVLKSYREHNPDNPNVHRNLYEFEKRYDGNQELQLQCLQDLITLDPCNPLAITLFKILEKKDPVDAPNVLFNFLDFDHCKDDVLVWKMFAQYLTYANEQSKTPKKTIIKCWNVRKDWWPSFILQFDDHQQTQSTKSSLIRYKQIVRSALCKILEAE